MSPIIVLYQVWSQVIWSKKQHVPLFANLEHLCLITQLIFLSSIIILLRRPVILLIESNFLLKFSGYFLYL